jgi:hypothetical protein
VTPQSTQVQLPELPLADWEETKQTLHLWAQIVGKVRLASTAPRNHWWHVALYVDVRGLTTRPMHSPTGVTFQIDFDFVDHRLVVRTGRGEASSFALEDGLSVASFDENLHAALRDLGIDVEIREMPFGVPVTTPFPVDVEHATYDPAAVERFRRILSWSEHVFDEFASWFCGKQSPVHLFWHSFDLALTRFGGKRAPTQPETDPVTQEAYSHELISFGFWTGDERLPEPAYYAYTAPEPAGLREQPLPGGARWLESNGSALGVLPYEVVRHAPDPRRALLAFMQTAYEAGATLAGWDRSQLESSWCPTPAELGQLVGHRSAPV